MATIDRALDFTRIERRSEVKPIKPLVTPIVTPVTHCALSHSPRVENRPFIVLHTLSSNQSRIQLYAPLNPLQAKQMLGNVVPLDSRSLHEKIMVGKPKLPNWLAYIRPHVKPYLALGRGERRKYVEKLSKQTKLSDNSLRRMIAAAQFLEAEGITDLPPGGRLPLGSVENIARIAAHEPSRRRELLDEVWAGRITIDQLAEELEKTRKNAKRRVNVKAASPQVSGMQLSPSVVRLLESKEIDPKAIELLRFDDDSDTWYFDLQTRPIMVIRASAQSSIVVMDGSQTGGTAASFMRQRKEFLRNVLAAACLYEAVIVYAPYWHDDLRILREKALPSVASRIIVILEPPLTFPT